MTSSLRDTNITTTDDEDEERHYMSRSRSQSSQSHDSVAARDAHDDWQAELRYRNNIRHHAAFRNEQQRYNIVMCFRCAEIGHTTNECITYKIKLCKHYMNGWCAMDDSRKHCTYAHGVSEMRQPWLKKCVRVVSKKYGDARVSGCGQVGHAYSECPDHN